MKRFFDCFRHWNMAPDQIDRFQTAQAIAVHEFGDQYSVSSTTEALAKRAHTLQIALGFPIMCQSPTDQALRLHDVEPVFTVRAHELRPDLYLDTHEVNRQFARFCAERTWTHVVLCAHPHHVWRAAEDLKKQGVLPLIPMLQHIGYDPSCSRHMLRSPLMFIPREIASRFIYMRKGWI